MWNAWGAKWFYYCFFAAASRTRVPQSRMKPAPTSAAADLIGDETAADGRGFSMSAIDDARPA